MKHFAITLSLLILLKFIESQETIEEILEHSDQLCSNPEHKHNPSINLAYITPWNNNGLDLGIKYAKKIDIISPCWFTIEPEGFRESVHIKIDGGNYVNREFMTDVKENNPTMKIIPRFQCKNFNLELYQEFFKPEKINQFLKVLMRRMRYNKLDGMILECNHIWVMEDLFPQFVDFMKQIKGEFAKKNMTLIITLFPLSDQVKSILNPVRMEYLSRYVDYFNIMTYDYMSHSNETVKDALIAPLTWVEKTLKFYTEKSKNSKIELNSKILLGIPFYGYVMEKDSTEPKGSILNAKSFQSLLQNSGETRLDWNKDECEHTISITKGKTGEDLNYIANYPTKKFIQERINLANKYNLGGVAIWELAQGFESFMDLI